MSRVMARQQAQDAISRLDEARLAQSEKPEPVNRYRSQLMQIANGSGATTPTSLRERIAAARELRKKIRLVEKPESETVDSEPAPAE